MVNNKICMDDKELVVVSHEFARHMSSDTPIIDIAKVVTRLASQLEVTTVALRQANAELKASVAAEIEWEKAMVEVIGSDGIADVVSAIEKLKAVAVTDEMTPHMMREVQLYSELGAYVTTNLSGAYDLFAEFWRVGYRAGIQKTEFL